MKGQCGPPYAILLPSMMTLSTPLEHATRPLQYRHTLESVQPTVPGPETSSVSL